MNNPDPSATLTFLATLGGAMVLKAMAISPAVDLFNPDWVSLLLIYWCIALPERFGVFTGWLVGLLIDVLAGQLLGQNALIHALICYFCVKEHRRLRQFPLAQQCLFVLFCLLASRSIVFGIESMKATAHHLPPSFWYPVLSGTLLWPAVFLLLRKIRVLARIN
ncbi:MAG: rod shape-determining protein MreD [Methylomonas sp.]|nr:rod shape-determining protein MreD [Methylomonas sp.]PPD20800.1 MAG: rod shape-determining protein MreD [Methylomonas sp.]PPD27277.1 MAG: rod shape-determining protein MreD [Methylomonas sp.]PPD38255.1 MAG: rod shape-determining protein MreD [Methylomonas sp.]PPD39248.1 MAG: rod shape-determining protein MreD [Methylomonas sp.]